jgi:predicted transcriptional regulator
MSVVSIRLTEEEEKMLFFLTDYLEKDKSAVIKSSLNDMYEDIIDREEIKKYETLERKGKVKFNSFEDIIKEA